MSVKPYRTVTIKLANQSQAELVAAEYGGTIERAGLLDPRSKVIIICETEAAFAAFRAKVDADVAGDIEES